MRMLKKIVGGIVIYRVPTTVPFQTLVPHFHSKIVDQVNKIRNKKAE